MKIGFEKKKFVCDISENEFWGFMYIVWAIGYGVYLFLH